MGSAYDDDDSGSSSSRSSTSHNSSHDAPAVDDREEVQSLLRRLADDEDELQRVQNLQLQRAMAPRVSHPAVSVAADAPLSPTAVVATAAPAPNAGSVSAALAQQSVSGEFVVPRAQQVIGVRVAFCGVVAHSQFELTFRRSLWVCVHAVSTTLPSGGDRRESRTRSHRRGSGRG